MSMESSSTDDPHIFNLHEELLVEVFHQLLLQRNSKRARRLLTICSVCQRWRNIALTTPSLWTEIRSLNLDFLGASISRSKAMPLSFSLDVDERCHHDLLPTVLHSLSQTRRLVVNNWVYARTTSASDAQWTTPAPILKVLRVRSVHFPANVFSGVAPCLRELRLTACQFNFDYFPRFPALKNLYIKGSASTNLTVQKLVDKLRWSPRLTSLTITCALSAEEPNTQFTGTDSDHVRVSLTNLEVMLLRSKGISSTLLLLNNLTIPAFTDVKIQVKVEREEENDDYSSIIDTLHQCRTSTTPIKDLRVVVSTDEHSFDMDAWDDDDILEVTSTYIEVEGGSEGSLQVDVAERAFRRLRLGNLQNLQLEGAILPESTTQLTPTKTFWDTVSSLPRLHTLQVHAGYARNFLAYFVWSHYEYTNSVLAANPSRGGQSPSLDRIYAPPPPPPPIPFPALRVLLYRDLGDGLNERIRLLSPALAVRWLFGYGLQRLIVVGSVPLEEWVVDRLKRVVGDVKMTTVVDEVG